MEYIDYDKELCAIYGKDDNPPDPEEDSILDDVDDGWTPSAVKKLISEELGA